MVSMDGIDVLPVFDTGFAACAKQATIASFAGQQFPHVVLGGTFDHLHAGHKVLLTVAAVLAMKGLAIGVSGPPLLSTKHAAETLEPWGKRASAVVKFVARVCPDLPVHLEVLLDGFGPSLKPHMNALIVSEETASGGSAVNERRSELGLEKAEVVVIPLVAGADGIGKQSSTDIRLQLDTLEALRKCWSTLINATASSQTRAAHWCSSLEQLAEAQIIGATATGRRSVVERIRDDLKLIASGSTEEVDIAHILALCVCTAVADASHDARNQHVALMELVAFDLNLPDKTVDAAQECLPVASRPRILRVTSAARDRALAEVVQRHMESWGALLMQQTGNTNEQCIMDMTAEAAEQLRSGSALVILPVFCPGERSCAFDEEWVVEATPTRPTLQQGEHVVLHIDNVFDVETQLARLCHERGLGTVLRVPASGADTAGDAARHLGQAIRGLLRAERIHSSARL